MKKLSVLVALSALAFAYAAPPSFAANAAPAVEMADHSVSTSKLIGAPVYNDQGQQIGSVVDVLVREAAVEPTAVLSVGNYVGGGSKLIAVPLSHVNLMGKHATMHDATRAMLSSMPAFAFTGSASGGNG